MRIALINDLPATLSDMKRLVIILILIFNLTVSSYGQEYGNLDWLSHFEKQSFDVEAIKKNNYTRVYVIETSGKRDVDGFAEVRDTLNIYYFDIFGHVITEHREKDSSITKVTVSEKDSTVFEYLFRNIRDHIDTAFILRRVYTKKGELIEHQLTPTNFYLRNTECATGAFHHYKYDYDESGRLIYYYDLRYWYYRRVHYTDYGKKVETFDFETNKLLDTEHVLVSKINDLANNTLTITETNRTKQVSKSYSDNLLTLETIVELGYFPYIKYIEYEYK